MNAVEAHRLGKGYGKRAWALRDVTLAIPTGSVVALVGPNGAGKSTLLNLVVGLADPSAGELTLLGGLVPGSPKALQRVAFVAQDAPLYPNLSVADTLRLAAGLSTRWDQAGARERLDALGIPLDSKAGRLSGGQRAKVALAVALGRRPDLLVLDEPLANLDPLARHELLATLLNAVAERDGDITVVFSSHVIADLERACDHLVLLAGGAVQVAGDIQQLLEDHVVLTGPAAEVPALTQRLCVVRQSDTSRQANLLVRANGQFTLPAGWRSHPVTLEELVLTYLRAPEASALPGPTHKRANAVRA